MGYFSEADSTRLFPYDGQDLYPEYELPLEPDQLDSAVDMIWYAKLQDPLYIEKHCSSYVIGQEETIRRVAVDVATVYKWKEKRIMADPAVRLLIGDTGQGKSAIFRALAKLSPEDLFVVNMAGFSETGIVGKSIEEDILEHIHPFMIIVLDEADKKIRREMDHGQNRNFTILSELNMALSGNDKRARGCAFFLLGAFSEIREAKRIEANSSSYGFTFYNHTSDIGYDQITTDDLLAYGMPRELSSRICIYQMNRLKKDDYFRIITQSKDSPIKRVKEKARLFGINLSISRSFIDKMVEEAYASEKGVRGLYTLFDIAVTDLIYKALMEHQTEIILDESCIKLNMGRRSA